MNQNDASEEEHPSVSGVFRNYGSHCGEASIGGLVNLVIGLGTPISGNACVHESSLGPRKNRSSDCAALASDQRRI